MQKSHILVSIFLIASGFLGPRPAQAQLRCEQIFSQTSPLVVSADWRPTSGGLFSAVRANAAHNWAYFKTLQPHLGALKEAFVVQGTAIGDFHILNIGDIELANGKRKLGLIDVDDGGHASLFADFTRAAISNQVSPYKVPLKDFWNSYLAGLMKEKLQKPDTLEDVMEKSHDDFLKRNEEYISSLTTDGKKFSSKAEVKSIEEADPLTADIYSNSLVRFKTTLGDAEILDSGYKIKQTGGSQGVPRFWFLIKKNGQTSIIEFKTLISPAMSVYRRQASQRTRIKNLIQTYRPQRTTYGLYEFVDGGKYQFIARERLEGFLEFNPEGDVSANEAERGRTVYLYLANHAGFWHAQQGHGEELFIALRKNEPAAFAEFEKIVNDYIELMKRENN